MKSIYATSIATALLLSSAAAQADVSISGKPTQNMSCDADVCTATAQKAVLNASDLQTMLASSDVAVNTGAIAKDIDIDQPLTWGPGSNLTLEAQRDVQVRRVISVGGGNAALSILTNQGGKGATF